MINRKYKHVKGQPYPQELRELVVAEYFRGVPRKELARKYNISEASVISHWVRIFAGGKRTLRLPNSSLRMPRTRKSNQTMDEATLKAEIRRLQKELSHKDALLREQSKRAERAELKNELLNMLVDTAEQEFQISIRKKSGPKQ